MFYRNRANEYLGKCHIWTMNGPVTGEGNPEVVTSLWEIGPQVWPMFQWQFDNGWVGGGGIVIIN